MTKNRLSPEYIATEIIGSVVKKHFDETPSTHSTPTFKSPAHNRDLTTPEGVVDGLNQIAKEHMSPPDQPNTFIFERSYSSRNRTGPSKPATEEPTIVAVCHYD